MQGEVTMKYQGIIFDLDGVICHTDKYHYQAWKSLADNLGIYFDEVINQRLRGVSRMESLEIILEGSKKQFTEEEKVQYAEEKNILYKKLLGKMTTSELSEEVKETLENLKNKGYKLAIGSSSKNAEFILEKIGLEGFFDVVVSGNHILNSKPDPEVFLKAAKLMGIEPEHCLVVEDAVAGIQAAINANMDCVEIGDTPQAEFATYQINNFKELLNVVEEKKV